MVTVSGLEPLRNVVLPAECLQKVFGSGEQPLPKPKDLRGLTTLAQRCWLEAQHLPGTDELHICAERLQPLGSVTVYPWVLQTCNVGRTAEQLRPAVIPDTPPWSLPLPLQEPERR